jgi:hypothetical protein
MNCDIQKTTMVQPSFRSDRRDAAAQGNRQLYERTELERLIKVKPLLDFKITMGCSVAKPASN